MRENFTFVLVPRRAKQMTIQHFSYHYFFFLHAQRVFFKSLSHALIWIVTLGFIW